MRYLENENRERDIEMNKFVTSLNITAASVVDFRNVMQVTGEFTFNGRLRADQRARFTAYSTDKGSCKVTEVNFTVEVVKAKHTQWRSMKACAQRDHIDDEVSRWVSELRRNGHSIFSSTGEQNENESENVLENESEKELDAAILRNAEFSDHKVLPVFNLNEVVAATAVKDSKDPLEIPNFLKRS